MALRRRSTESYHHEGSFDAAPPEILVAPAAEHAARARLFDALSAVLGVRFTPDARSPVAVIRLGGGELGGTGGPGVQLVHHLPEDVGGARVDVSIDADGVDGALGGRTIGDDRIGDAVVPAAGGRVVAATDHGPVWTRDGSIDQVAIAPAELEPDERLRARFTTGRFAALLPILELARRVAPSHLPRTTPMATFVFDDPNLRHTTYGWLRYDELARHAERHDYHVNLAVIPLDCWSVSRRAADLIRRTDRLSLVGHGNDHLRHELAARDGDLAARAGQAVARLAEAGRRWDLDFEPVMVPPHGKCSPPMMDALLATGWEAAAYWGPTRPSAQPALEGWLPADRHVGDGLPGLLRTVFATTADELAFRRHLGHGLVLYGHHDDVSEGLDVLAEAAARVRSLGEVEWGSLAAVARSRVTTHRHGPRLDVTPYCRHTTLRLDGSVEELVIRPAPTARQDSTFRLSVDGDDPVSVVAGDVVDVAGPGQLVISEPTDHTVAAEVGRRAIRPLGRRLLTESRDRLTPVAAGLRDRGRPSRRRGSRR